MTNNDILRRLRYALNLNDAAMVEIFLLAEHKIKAFSVSCLLKKEEEETFVECSDLVLNKFLDGFITSKRGPSDKPRDPKIAEKVAITNNLVLKKLRIALELKEEDMLAVMDLAEFRMTKPELSAIFRNPGSRNYKACGDQVLRNFLQGLTKKYR